MRFRRPTAHPSTWRSFQAARWYLYPRTGRPGENPIEGWDAIQGARGCTPQSCSFRDHFADLKSLGVDRVFGLSTQDTDYQNEAAVRLHLPFPILSDAELKLAWRW